MNFNRFQAFFNGPAQTGSMFNIHRFMAGEQHLEEGDKNYRQEIIQTDVLLLFGKNPLEQILQKKM